MPKVKNNISNDGILQYITEFGKNVFSSDGKILFRKFCETKINTNRRHLVSQHLKTEKPISAEKRKQNQITKTSFYCYDLIKKIVLTMSGLTPRSPQKYL